ncbi:aminoacrylate peracid reductase [Planctomycetaceae bacterium]|nr:aminoacrylate peracid reductase [Planctomycetaceae bacterium]
MARKPSEEDIDESTDIYTPDGWPRPKGYSNVVVLPHGRPLFIAGMVGWDENEKMVSLEIVGQFRQALKNIVACARAAGSNIEFIGRMTLYVTDKAAYLASRRELGRAWRDVMGEHYPAMSLVEVKGLLEEGGVIEVEATGVVPDQGTA